MQEKLYQCVIKVTHNTGIIMCSIDYCTDTQPGGVPHHEYNYYTNNKWLWLLTLGAHAHSEGYSSCRVCVCVCMCVCVYV